MITSTQSHQIICNAIANKVPFTAGKLGANECNTIYQHINKSSFLVSELETVAGVFPLNHNTVYEFSKLYLDVIKDIDVLLKWADTWGEQQVLDFINYTYPQPNEFSAIEPFFIENNWTNCLGGKKVLVVSSHINSIEHQYSKLDKIWNGKLFKNKFELYLLKSPFQPQFEQYHNTWFETLDWLKQSIKEIDFDVLLIGAGAYGLPLAVEAKRLGKVGIHLGGAIQLLFGLKGKRWSSSPDFISLHNDYWIHPLKEDTPPNKEMIEGGCYW